MVSGKRRLSNPAINEQLPKMSITTHGFFLAWKKVLTVVSAQGSVIEWKQQYCLWPPLRLENLASLKCRNALKKTGPCSSLTKNEDCDNQSSEKRDKTNLVRDPRSDDRADPTEGGTRSHGRSSDGRWKQLRCVDVHSRKCATESTFSDQKCHLIGGKAFLNHCWLRAFPSASNMRPNNSPFRGNRDLAHVVLPGTNF